MEVISTIPSRPERARLELSEPLLTLLGLSLATLTAIDFAIHFDGGLSDPQMRDTMTHLFGRTLIRHIGNFGLAAALTIPLAVVKKVAERADPTPWDETIFDHALEGSYQIGLAGIFAGVLLMESFPGNNEFWGDIGMTLFGIADAKLVTEDVLHKLRVGRHRSLPSRVDKLFPTPHPTFLSRVGNSVDEIFP